MKTRHHFYFLLTVFIGVVTILLSDNIRILLFTHTQIDTVGHFISFFCLTLMLHSLCKFPLFNTLLSLSFYAALSEIGQYYLGFRNGELRDFIADILGILAFGLAKWAYQLYWQKKAL